MSYIRRMLSWLASTGRYAVIVVGIVGLCTSVQLACSFNTAPPEDESAKNAKQKKNPVVDSGPIDPGSSSGTSGSSSSSGSSGTSGGYYGYGYGPDGCYGYGYGYDTAYAGSNPNCD